MKSRLSRRKKAAWSLAAVTLLAGWLFGSRPASSQIGEAPKKAADMPTPRTTDGHPDLSGYWSNPPPLVEKGGTQQFERAKDGSILFDFNVEENSGRICLDDSCQESDQPSYKPEYAAKVAEIAHSGWGGTKPGDPTNQCRPLGVPRAFAPMQIVQNSKAIAILYEAAPYTTNRLIYMDGRPHSTDIEPSYMGDSIGHWEGDTLVVDVVGLNDLTWLGGDVPGHHMYTTLHSDKEHVIERWTRKGNLLTYEATVEDPVMLAKPWVIPARHVQIADPSDSFLESVCTPFDVSLIVKPLKGDTGCPIRCTPAPK